jgi:hypothetical protein
VTDAIIRCDVDAAPDGGVRNSQPEGIGRVVALHELVCWNNLGRNVVFADRNYRPRAVFGTTLFPGQDEPSQYDLDIHAVLDVAPLGLVVVLNHLGVVRAFRRSEVLGMTGGQLIKPAALWWYGADVERTVCVDDRLVGSAPRSDGALGLLVSAPLSTAEEGGPVATELTGGARGEVTALCTVPSDAVRSADSPLLAMGGNEKIALAPLRNGQVGEPRWEAGVGFRVAMLAWHDGALWAAGPDSATAADDYDWERLRGGGFALLSPADGAELVSGPLPDDVAWGTGGVAVAPCGPLLAAAGRTGRLYLIDPHNQEDRRSSPPVAGQSLGIAHMAVSSGQALCGFNRGGYRLHAYAQSPAGAGSL